MASIFEMALGQDFQKLHPMLQKRFGVDTAARYGCVGQGVFSEVRRGALWTVPFLRLGAYRNILFPDEGNDIPFTIENYPYVDGFGRPTAGFTFPAVCTGTADLHESFDDIRGVFTIQMQVRNPVVGFLFGYRGEFTCTYPPLSGTTIPAHLKPLREESRE